MSRDDEPRGTVRCDFAGCEFRTTHLDKMERHLLQRHTKGDDLERIVRRYVGGLEEA